MQIELPAASLMAQVRIETYQNSTSGKISSRVSELPLPGFVESFGLSLEAIRNAHCLQMNLHLKNCLDSIVELNWRIQDIY